MSSNRQHNNLKWIRFSEVAIQFIKPVIHGGENLDVGELNYILEIVICFPLLQIEDTSGVHGKNQK